MKLSEAILKGSQIRPQGFDNYFVKWPDGTVRSCALGAAYEAITGSSQVPDFDFIEKWPDEEAVKIATKNVSTNGVCGCEMVSRVLPVANLVSHLNDHHKWTREKIAEWVSTVEKTENI